MKVLIVEDTEELLNSILSYLNEDQFHCEYALNLQEAREKLAHGKYDCVLLDIGLPDGSGLELLKDIKKMNSEMRVMIISANSSTQHKVEGLNGGADDYLAKPFDLPELNARINSMMRRYKSAESSIIFFNEIKVHTDTFQVFINEHEINLTKKEYDLLVYFIVNKNKVISKHALLEHLWDNFQDSWASVDLLYAQIKNLRKKILAGGGNDYIKNINRIGYRFI
ncbi:MAG TPA: response regulator transcription factor [Cytophagaceae bacterium]|nr:response regulator transcription factor [Cytophagaceae bacterium]